MLRVAGDTAAYAEATIPSVAVRTVVLQLWGACALTLVLVTFSVVRLQLGWSALLQTVILAAGLAAAAVRMRMPPSSLTFAAGPMLLVVILNLATAYTHERLQRSDYLSHWELERERARSEAVLRNVLPAAIAERLKSGEAGIADDHPAVTVLFADIVDFTPWAGSRPAREVVEYLNEVFSRFDRLVEAHGLEKLKTIGDAYLAVAGAPLPRADHVEAAARLALAMQADLASLNLAAAAPLQLRIGIHTGPLVAGVLGEKRFQYDVWGDTVNTASRLEAQGLPGAIQVSSEVARQLQGAFVLTRRQQIEIKGKGPMTTYLLEGEVVEREDARPNSG
jgi:class 3 adenylate cyclase